MITCSVCGKENDDLAVICSHCKSYLQSKVNNLNLFETIWTLIESPRSAFKRIALARHKNYVFLLSSLLGMSLAYTLLWYKNLGGRFSNVLTLVGTGILTGPPLGILFVFLFSAVMLRIGKLLGGKATMRNTFAVVSYAAVPIIFSLVIVFPIEIAIFGLYFFDNNPPPLVINPVIYVTLIGFDLVAVLWSWILLIEGSIVSNGFTRTKSVLITLAVMVVTGVCALGIRFL